MADYRKEPDKAFIEDSVSQALKGDKIYLFKKEQLDIVLESLKSESSVKRIVTNFSDGIYSIKAIKSERLKYKVKNIKTGEIEFYESRKQVSKDIGISETNISKCICLKKIALGTYSITKIIKN